jgi:hypothetical protein
MDSMHNQMISDGLVLASRRRARRRPRRRSRGAIPDWVWGLALGIFAVVIIGGGYLIMNAATGGGGTSCDEPLAALGAASDLTAQGFQEEDEALARVVQLAQANQRADAESAFYAGGVHNFTHNADPSIRQADEQLAKQLCEAVFDLEDNLIEGTSFDIARDAQRVKDLLRDGAEALGFPRPQ